VLGVMSVGAFDAAASIAERCAAIRPVVPTSAAWPVCTLHTLCCTVASGEEK